MGKSIQRGKKDGDIQTFFEALPGGATMNFEGDEVLLDIWSDEEVLGGEFVLSPEEAKYLGQRLINASSVCRQSGDSQTEDTQQ